MLVNHVIIIGHHRFRQLNVWKFIENAKNSIRYTTKPSITNTLSIAWYSAIPERDCVAIKANYWFYVCILQFKINNGQTLDTKQIKSVIKIYSAALLWWTALNKCHSKEREKEQQTCYLFIYQTAFFTLNWIFFLIFNNWSNTFPRDNSIKRKITIHSGILMDKIGIGFTFFFEPSRPENIILQTDKN